ncbi:unnamed protein product [Cuscuta epithymum]|uniref:Nudix hydrolase domain-containing protein n=1 Tax=Cuscuta epithymum TaxID=186058 RepID=A0AAV0CP40_9ASTE|nr:unnamed protein product [Cuscuta epithymum]
MDPSAAPRSEMLVNLARRLSLYKPAHSLDEPSSENLTGQADDKVAQNVGLNSKSVTNPITITPPMSKSKRAAVLICLFEGESGDLCVVLTKRSSKLSSHPGEVALPGGKMEEGDANDIETALREAKEEIGLDPSIVHVITLLESFTNKKGMTVIPVVGLVWDRSSMNLVANADEVDSIFYAPLEMFLKNENRTEEEREWMGNKYLLHFFNHQSKDEVYIIWALTAGILINAATIIYQRPPNFEERRPIFWK